MSLKIYPYMRKKRNEKNIFSHFDGYADFNQCFATTVFASPVHKYIDTASESADIHREGRIGCQYRGINGVLYKRLYDYVATKP